MPSCNPEITRENVGQVGTFHFPYAATLRLHRLNLPLRLRKHLVGVKIPDFGRHDPGRRWSREGGRLAREATARLTTAMAAPEEIYLAAIRNLERISSFKEEQRSTPKEKDVFHLGARVRHLLSVDPLVKALLCKSYFKFFRHVTLVLRVPF